MNNVLLIQISLFVKKILPVYKGLIQLGCIARIPNPNKPKDAQFCGFSLGVLVLSVRIHGIFVQVCGSSLGFAEVRPGSLKTLQDHWSSLRFHEVHMVL